MVRRGAWEPLSTDQGDELVTESEGGVATNVKVPLALFHGGAVAGSGASDPASTYGGPYDQAAARTYYTTGEVYARGVYAFGAHRRKSLPQQVAHDVGGSPSRAGSEHGSLGVSQVGSFPNGTSGGTASGGNSHCPADRSGRCDVLDLFLCYGGLFHPLVPL